jgi:type I restriction enzyme M protein
VTRTQKDLSFEKELWKAADKLRSRGGISPSEYKNIVLGLIFLRYISYSFEKRRKFLIQAVSDKNIHDEEGKTYYVSQPELRRYVVEDKSQYEGYGSFYILPKARWSYLLKNINSPELGKFIDKAMELIERENPKRFGGILPKSYAASNVPSDILGELIKLFANIDFGDQGGDKDFLGRVYEYFIGQFADSEGKRGGEFYTPRSQKPGETFS